MAICVMAVVGVAPCQCFWPGGIQTTSPGRISSTGPPQRCARPQPAVTIKVCPSGCVCHAVRAPGSNVTLAPNARAGAGGLKSGSIRTVPVKYSAGPLPDGCKPHRLISIESVLCLAAGHLLLAFRIASPGIVIVEAASSMSLRFCIVSPSLISRLEPSEELLLLV